MNRSVRIRMAAAAAVAAVLATVLVTPSARADLFNPRQDWLRASTAGLFLHWGLRTNRGVPGRPPFTNKDCAAWEDEVTGGGWTPDSWLQAAHKLHAQYLVLATFHSRLGYARPWPSAIPGSCSTRRDFLGETIAAAKAKGLHVILYMTDDPKWFWEGLQPANPAPDPTDLTKPSWFDSAAYSAYKGHQANLNTRPGFGEFSYDNFFEVMHRYPDLAGFWIDNVNQYWTDPAHDLFAKIRDERPDMLLSNNNEDTPLFDTVSNEQKTGMTPAYDYPQGTWTPLPRLTEADFKLPTSGNWWFDGKDSAVDYGLTIGRLVTNVGASSKALMAETSKVDGTFPSNQLRFNDFANVYLDQIWESLSGVEGGGYLYGGLKPGAWNDGAYGATTVRRDNPDVHYVHVLTKPTTGSTITLRDNGYRVARVTDLRTGEPLPFSQSDGNLSIEGITTWDRYDTVFTVETAGRTGIYAGVTATATAAAAGHDASALVDGSYLNYWDNGGTLPVSLTLDLGTPRPVAYLGINQREWSVVHPSRAGEDSARIKEYKVFASDDGVAWTEVQEATLPSARAVQIVDLKNAPTARFVRLEVDSTWAVAANPRFYRQLRIDEMWAAGAYAAPALPTGHRMLSS